MELSTSLQKLISSINVGGTEVNNYCVDHVRYLGVLMENINKTPGWLTAISGNPT